MISTKNRFFSDRLVDNTRCAFDVTESEDLLGEMEYDVEKEQVQLRGHGDLITVARNTAKVKVLMMSNCKSIDCILTE